MKVAAAIAGMLASAAIGAAGGAWVMASRAPGGTVQAVPDEARPALARTPMGDLAGVPEAWLPLTQPNPLGDGPAVVAKGKRLFVRMNCAGCHNYGGRGGMGPDLTDLHWEYGGTPAAIYKTIYEGRSKGMPAWGRALPPEALWALTAYVGSLGGGVPPEQAQAERQGDFIPMRHDTEALAPEASRPVPPAGSEPARDDQEQ